MAVLYSSINENGDLDINKLENNLLNINGVTESGIEKKGENGQLPWIVTVDKWKFEIEEDGTVNKISGISLNAKKIKIVAGESSTLKATLTEGINGNIVWSVEDENVVTITPKEGETIKIDAVGTEGSTKIIATVITENETYTAECTVTIISRLTSLTVSNLSILPGTSEQLKVTTQPSGEVEDLIYESSNNSSITIDENGLVTVSKEAIIGETAEITVRGALTGVEGKATVTVVDYIELFTYMQQKNLTPQDFGWTYTTTTDSGWVGTLINQVTLNQSIIKYKLSIGYDASGYGGASATFILPNNFEEKLGINISKVEMDLTCAASGTVASCYAYSFINGVQKTDVSLTNDQNNKTYKWNLSYDFIQNNYTQFKFYFPARTKSKWMLYESYINSIRIYPNEEYNYPPNE